MSCWEDLKLESKGKERQQGSARDNASLEKCRICAATTFWLGEELPWICPNMAALSLAYISLAYPRFELESASFLQVLGCGLGNVTVQCGP